MSLLENVAAKPFTQFSNRQIWHFFCEQYKFKHILDTTGEYYCYCYYYYYYHYYIVVIIINLFILSWLKDRIQFSVSIKWLIVKHIMSAH